MAVTENMLVDIQVKSGDAEKQVIKLGQELEILNKKVVSNNEAIKRSSAEFARNSSAINMAVNNYDRTQSTIKNTDTSVKKLNQSLATSSQTMVQYNSSTAMANTTVMKMSSNIRNLEMAVNSLTMNVQFLIRSIKYFTDPKVLKNISDVSNVLGALAYSKGMGGTANALREVGKSFDTLSTKSQNFRDNADNNLNDVVERARLLNEVVEKSPSAFKVLSGAIALAAGDMVYSYSKAQKANKALDSQILTTGETSRKTFSKLATDVEKPVSGFSKMTAGIRHSASAVEALSLLSPVLIILGNKLKESENAFIRWGGVIMKTIGIISAGLMGFIGLALGAFAALSISIGNNILASTQEAMDKFIKFESVMAQFKFTVQGFSKVFGVDAVGSMEYWNKTMQQLYKTTVFTREELSKSIKLLIAEGQVIGLTVEDNTKLLDRAADVAAATGRDLYEVTQMIINGLTNNADAVLGLGIDIRNTSLAHSKYVEESGLAVEQMSAQELAMARLNALYEKTVPLVGAAANQTKTIAGSNMIYQKTLTDISVAIGQTGTATELYYASINKFLSVIRDLPKPLLSTYGSLKDILGVTLVIIGQMLKLGAVVFALTTVFKLLNFVLSSTWGITVSLSATLLYLGTVILPITAFVIALIASMKDLIDTSKGFEDTLKSVTGSLFVFSETVDGAEKSTFSFASGINRLINIALLPFKIVLIAIADTVNIFGIAFINIKKIFTSNDKTISEYNSKLNILWSRLRDLSNATGKAFKALDFFSESSALAASKTKELIDTQEKGANLTQKYKERVLKLAAAINEGFDKGIERQKFLGNEFDKSIATYKQAQNELNNVFKTKSTDKDAAQKYADNERKVLQASLEIDKLRLDTLKKINEQRKTLETEILRSQGRNIEAINREKIENLKAIDEQIAGLKLLENFKQEDLKTLEETRKLIEKSSDIKVGEERSKSLQKAIEAEKLLADLKRENARLDKNIVDDLKGRVEGRSQEIKKMEEALRLSNDLYGRSKQAIAESKVQVDKMFDTGLARVQMDLLNELNIKRQEMQDNVNKETLTQFENINLAYEKEKELLDIKRQQYETQGLMNESMKAQFGQMDELLKQQKELQIKKAPGKESEALEKTGSNIAGSIASTFSTGAMGMVTGAMGMVSAIADIVDKILDFVPQFINKIAGIFDKITNLPKVLLDSVKNLSRAAIDMVKNAIPNLINYLPDIVDELITLLFEGLPDAFMSLIDSLPDIINKFMDRLPELVERIITGLIESAPRIMAMMIQAQITLIPALWKAWYKYMLKIPGIIVNGIVEGLKKIGNLFKGISIKGPNIKKTVEGLKLGMKAATKTLTGEASKLFQVMDLGASDTTKDALKDIPGNIEKGAKKAVDYLTMWWRKLIKELQAVWDGIVSVWRNLWDGIKVIWSELIRAGKAVVEFLKNVWDKAVSALKSVFDFLKSVWDEIWKFFDEKIIQPLKDAWNEVWKFFDEKIIQPLTAAWNAVWKFFDENIIQPISKVFSSISEILFKAVDGFRDVFDFFMKGITFIVSIFKGVAELLKPIADVFSKVFGGIADVFSAVDWSSIGTKIGEAFSSVFDGVKGFFSKFYNTLADLINAMKIPAFEYGVSILGKKYSGKLWNEIDLVPGNIAYLADGGFIPRGTDTIPAMLSPGEFVLNKNATQGLGLNFLNNLNRGGGQTSQPNITLNIQIETTQPIDETFFRNNLMPRIKDDIRRRTLNGEFIISSKGVR